MRAHLTFGEEWARNIEKAIAPQLAPRPSLCQYTEGVMVCQESGAKANLIIPLWEGSMFRRFHLLVFSSFISFTAFSQFEPKTTVGGYGELHYHEPDGSQRGVLDLTRFVIYLSHDFNEKLSFRSEMEIEHTKIEAGDPHGGEVAIEQAFLEYRLHKDIGLRAGVLLLPVGLTNLYHEPPTFNGVERPAVEQFIIPTTWRESGAGMFGTPADGLSYQLYVVAGLDAEGFSAGNGIRDGRQEALESNPANPSLTGRVDYSPILGLMLGGSFFIGNSAADHDSIGNAAISMWSGDVRYSVDRFNFKAVGTIAAVGETNKINAKFGNGVADRIFGYYVEGAYNILPLLCSETEQELNTFVRYERYNTQAAVTGFPIMNRYNRNDVVLGSTYKPTYNTAFKLDYTFQNNRENAGANKNTGQLNLGIGYYFF